MSRQLCTIVVCIGFLQSLIPLALSDDPLAMANRSIAATNQYISTSHLDRFDFGESEVGGVVFGWSLGPGQAGDLASIGQIKAPIVNISYDKGEGVTVYRYRLFLTLRQLFFIIHYQFKTFMFNWGRSEVVLSSADNSMDVECHVHLGNDGRCAANLKNANVRHLRLSVAVLPDSAFHSFLRGFIWLCSNLLVWRTMDSLNEVVQEIVQLNIPDSPFSDIVCKAFME